MSFWKKATSAAAIAGRVAISMSPFGTYLFVYDTVDFVSGHAAKISVRKIHVANSASCPITVVVTPNKDWVFADVGAAIAMLAVNFASSAPSGLSGIQAAKSLWDLYTATRHYRAVAGVASALWGFFSKKGCLVQSRDYKCVNQRSNSNPLDYMTPSQYSALLKGSDYTLYIVAEDGRSLLFNTNSDTSWIIDDSGAAPVKYGKIWQRDTAKSAIAWNS